MTVRVKNAEIDVRAVRSPGCIPAGQEPDRVVKTPVDRVLARGDRGGKASAMLQMAGH